MKAKYSKPQTKRMKRAKGGSTRRPGKEVLQDYIKRKQSDPTRRPPRQSKPDYDRQKRLPKADDKLDPFRKLQQSKPDYKKQEIPPRKTKPKFKDNPEDRFGKYRRHKAWRKRKNHFLI